jgi:hypothetical protein
MATYATVEDFTAYSLDVLRVGELPFDNAVSGTSTARSAGRRTRTANAGSSRRS